jgi:Uma2 family endonuclease
MAIQNPKRLISIDEYHRMGEDGLFSEDDRVELIEGEIHQMTPIGNPHATGVRRLIHLFTGSFDGRVVVDIQNPVQMDDWSEPQPDITLLSWRDDYYAAAAPTAADVVLLVEVADSSVGFDRGVKAPLYARHGVREYWIVDLPAGLLEVHRRPTSDSYRDVRRLRRGDSITLEAFPDTVFAVFDLLGPEREG